MGRPLRTEIGGYPYHVLNRANARIPIFTKPTDYHAFEVALTEAHTRTDMPILAYCVMPNHWHLVVHPREDGQLAPFMRWLTLTHTQRWHTAHGTVGTGHLYQGRYKSFLIETDNYLLQVLRYVERNPARAHLVVRAEEWRWSSLWRRLYGTDKERQILSPWPVPAGEHYLEWVNKPESTDDLATIRAAAVGGAPYGSAVWTERVIAQFGLASTVRVPGRPSRRVGNGS